MTFASPSTVCFASCSSMRIMIGERQDESLAAPWTSSHLPRTVRRTDVRTVPLRMGDHGLMGLFTRHASGVDARDRDYLLTDCPLVAQDDQVVLVDVTVRLAVRRATDDTNLVLGYNPAEETAVHAICVLLLRQMATDVPSDELLTG